MAPMEAISVSQLPGEHHAEASKSSWTTASARRLSCTTASTAALLPSPLPSRTRQRPPSRRVAMNAVLQSYDEHRTFATTKAQCDTRPSGNEPRNLLTKPGLLTALLHERYAGESLQAELEAVAAAQQDTAPSIVPDATAHEKQVLKKKKRRVE
eukprot:3997158-Pleurochrysis_carterae.AAC.1